MTYNFDEVIDRRHTQSVKFDVLDEDVLPLWVADMDFRAPERVIDALKKRVEHGVFGYTLEHPDLKGVLVQRMKDRYDWTITPDDIVFVPAVVAALNSGIRAAGRDGDNVLMQTPVYPPFLMSPEANQQVANPVDMAMTENDGILHYEIDFDAFEAAIDDRTSSFLLCSPHNPTGRVWKKDELQRMAEICLKHDITIISDEIHCDLIFEDHIPIAALSAEIANQTITLMAPSKTFNIPSLGFSFAVVPNEDLRKRFVAQVDWILSHVGVFGFTAALAAYQHGDEWLKAALTYIKANRDFTTDYIRQHMPEIKLTHPEGTYLSWLDCRQLPMDTVEVEESNPLMEWIEPFFLQYARVGLNNGGLFGEAGKGFARLNFACPRSVLEQALERMKQAYDEKISGA